MRGRGREYEKATFAGGCFWCMQPPFEKLKGVVEVKTGYTGGRTINPTYENVSSGLTGHVEAVQITYDPSEVTYSELLEVFWKQIDPTDSGGQFADRGTQYKTAIFVHNEKQKDLAEESKKKLEQSGKFKEPIITEIKNAATFYKAEEYHQGYYKKCAIKYNLYKSGSGREAYLKNIWENK